MKPIQHILIPTDFEAASREAIEVAMTVARAFDAKVTLLHVWEIPIYPYLDFTLNTTLIANVEEAATNHLSRVLEDVRKDWASASSMLKQGWPSGTIIDVIKELAPDLVVMGTHGRHGFSHTILGSVAEKVVRSSEVPVLTVHASKAV